MPDDVTDCRCNTGKHRWMMSGSHYKCKNPMCANFCQVAILKTPFIDEVDDRNAKKLSALMVVPKFEACRDEGLSGNREQ